jgi:hypothetical protein
MNAEVGGHAPYGGESGARLQVAGDKHLAKRIGDLAVGRYMRMGGGRESHAHGITVHCIHTAYNREKIVFDAPLFSMAWGKIAGNQVKIQAVIRIQLIA